MDSLELDLVQIAPEPEKKWGWIKNEWINVRRQPTTNSNIVTRLQRGSRVELLEEDEEWWHVELEDGARAYIHSSLIYFDQYVDPWTQFRMGCRLADSSLTVIESVAPVSSDDSPSAYLQVAEGWAGLEPQEQRHTVRKAYHYWQECLEEAGYKLAGATLFFRDSSGRDVAKVSRDAAGAVAIKLMDY
jgi:hypothetical protein